MTTRMSISIARLLLSLGALASSVACGGTVQHVPAGTQDGGIENDASAGDTGLHTEPAIDAGLPPGACRSTSDCANNPAEYCAGPYDGPCQGGCAPQVACTSDSQCDGGAVCRPGPFPTCGQMPGAESCLPPCGADSDCPPTETCSAGHCQPRSCSQCPSYFSCTGGVCARKACASDGDCSEGYCVNGSCGASFGTCMGGCG